MLFDRSSGERAFDCALLSLFPFVLLTYVPFLIASRSEEFPPEANWIAFSIGVAALCFWAWLARSVAAAWHDPFARVLRFSSSLLLLFYAVNAALTDRAADDFRVSPPQRQTRRARRQPTRHAPVVADL